MGVHKNKAYNLRLEEELMNKIRQLAEENYRPISKQIELIILEWLELKENEEDTLPPPQ